MTESTQTKAVSAPTPPAAKLGRKKLKAEGRKKRVLKLKTDPAFAKSFFESKAKRAADKKSGFRKKKSRKK